MSRIRSALIIGGGVAGPTTGAALARAGIQATIFEAYPSPSEGLGGALALAPNGVAALGIIGADRVVIDAAIPITGGVMSIGGRQVPMPQPPDLPPLRVVDRTDLHRILRERAGELGVRTEWGRRLRGVEEAPGQITARFEDGTTATADILIGADGSRSTVRRLIDPSAPGAAYTGLLGFETRTDVDLGLPPGRMFFAYGKTAYSLFWALPDGGTYWGANLPSARYLSLKDARATPAATWLRTLRETYAGDHPAGLLATRARPEDLQVTGALQIMPPVPHWWRGRMVLVGDSVHAPSNSSGQGASLAIESSIQLARCLRDADDVAAALTAYEGLRRARVEKIARRGASLNRTKAPGPVMRRALPLLMRAAFRVLPVERTMREEQGYVIDWDQPVAGEVPASPAVGVR